MSESLRGRVALISGGSRGIGREIALGLAREGVKVAIAAKSIEAKPGLPGTIFTVAEEIEALGGEALPLQCDVRDDAQIEATVQKVMEHFGRLDILINNAGALWWQPVADTPAKRFDLMMDVNVRASFLLSRAVMPHMIKEGWGHIINMSPPVDLRVLKGRVGYFISKYGMTMLAQGLSMELEGHNVAANALWPATLIDSQATRNWGMGTEADWRKASIMVDATLAILKSPPKELRGRALIDEEILEEAGVTDFSPYNCVEGGDPVRILPDDVLKAMAEDA